MLDAVEAGHASDQTHSVGVQLYAHKARAAARMGDARLDCDSLDAGRARPDRLSRPDHPEHHFIIDPDKWDFYEMDAYRLLGDDERAATHARSVICISTCPDGTEISPMRAAEAVRGQGLRRSNSVRPKPRGHATLRLLERTAPLRPRRHHRVCLQEVRCRHGEGVCPATRMRQLHHLGRRVVQGESDLARQHRVQGLLLTPAR